MRVTDGMIAPQLRTAGKAIRTVMPYVGDGAVKAANALTVLLKGHAPKDMRYEQHQLRRPDGSLLRMCVYAPGNDSDGACSSDTLDRSDKSYIQHGRPGILFLHGGGFELGCPELEIGLIRTIVRATGGVVFTPDYRLSVEAPYPAALTDCYQALQCLAERAESYGIDTRRLMVVGDSAGGGLTAALTLLARDRGEIPISFQMSLYPMLDDHMTSGSMRDNDAPVWNERSNRIAWQRYLGPLYGTDDVPAYAAPARAVDLSDLPPTATFVGSVDPFLCETAEYVNRLRAASVPVRFKVIDGAFHWFDVVAPKSPQAQTAMRFVGECLREAAYSIRAFPPSH